MPDYLGDAQRKMKDDDTEEDKIKGRLEGYDLMCQTEETCLSL